MLATVPKLVGSVYSVAYANNGQMLAVGTGDVEERVPGTALIVEPATGALRQKLPDLPGKVEAMFTVDSRYLITVNSSKKRPAEIRFWNPATGQLVGQLDNPTELAGLNTITLSPDGHYLVSGHGDPVNPAAADKAKIKIWDLATQKIVGQFPASHPAAITQIAFSRRGTLMASGDMQGNVRLWDFASRRLLPKQLASQGRPITYIAFDKLGERLAVAADEKCVRVWHIDTGRQLAIMELALGVPNVVGYTQDGKTLAAATSAGGLFLWDADTYKPRSVLRGEGNPAGQQGHGGVITCVAPLQLPDKMLTGSIDKTVRVWDLKSRQAVGTVATFNNAVSCMAVSPDGRSMAVGTGKYRSKFETGELAICDLSNGRNPPKSLSKGITPVSVAYSPDGNLLAVCSLSAAVGPASRTVSIIDMRHVPRDAARQHQRPLRGLFARRPDLGCGMRGRVDRALAVGFARADEAFRGEEAPRAGLDGSLLARRPHNGLRQRRQQRDSLGRADRRRPDDLEAQRHGRGAAVLAGRADSGHGRARACAGRRMPVARAA